MKVIKFSKLAGFWESCQLFHASFWFFDTEFWKIEAEDDRTLQNTRTKDSLDIGANKFSTSLQTLRTDSESMFGDMFSGRHPIPKQEEEVFLLTGMEPTFV